MTDEQFNIFLKELNVVIADIGAGLPEVAWKHYNEKIYDISKKINHITKNTGKGQDNG